MERLQFAEPVRIRLHDNIIELKNVHQALEFLNQWPPSRRGPVYKCAVQGCEAAVVGHLTCEEACHALTSFAQITGILEIQNVKLAG